MDVASNVGLGAPRPEDVELVVVVERLAGRFVDDVGERDLHLAEEVVPRDAVHIENLKHLEQGCSIVVIMLVTELTCPGFDSRFSA